MCGVQEGEGEGGRGRGEREGGGNSRKQAMYREGENESGSWSNRRNTHKTEREPTQRVQSSSDSEPGSELEPDEGEDEGNESTRPLCFFAQSSTRSSKISSRSS